MASSSNLGPTQGPILLGKNYEFWSLRMRSFLQAQECWDPVDHGYVEPDPADLSAMTNQQKLLRQHKETKKIKLNFGFKILWMIQFSQKSQALVLQNRPGTSLNLPIKEMTGSKQLNCRP
jgi:hypothetical protein